MRRRTSAVLLATLCALGVGRRVAAESVAALVSPSTAAVNTTTALRVNLTRDASTGGTALTGSWLAAGEERLRLTGLGADWDTFFSLLPDTNTTSEVAGG
jgi:hypothetical protein